MKKIVKIVAILVLLAAIILPIEHYYCDNIYGFFAFSKSPVVKVNDKVYRCAKDEPEDFINYMIENGWNKPESIAQLGNAYFLEKDGKTMTCLRRIKKFYAEWHVTVE